MRSNEGRVESAADREVVITRVFDAPARLLFEAYSKREHVMQSGQPSSRPFLSFWPPAAGPLLPKRRSPSVRTRPRPRH